MDLEEEEPSEYSAGYLESDLEMESVPEEDF